MICTAGAACALPTWRKPMWIGRKPMKWAIGTEPVGIGIRTTAVTRSFPRMESSTAHLAGASIRRSTWALLRSGGMDTITITSVPTGTIGATVDVMNRITTTTSIMAFIMGPALMATAGSLAVVKSLGSMVEKGSTVVAAFMVAEASMAAEAFMVAAEAVAIAES